jgi:hypothetical protein
MGRRIHSETAYVYFDKLLARRARRIATTLQVAGDAAAVLTSISEAGKTHQPPFLARRGAS